MKFDKIIGIDPGFSGGIVTWDESQITGVKMPSYKVKKSNGKMRSETDAKSLQSLFEELSDNSRPIVFLELVQPWTGKDDPTRQAQIARLMANFETIKTILSICNIPFILVRPQDWQKYLNLKVKGESPSEGKKRYKRYAQSCYPGMKMTAWSADAACLVDYGRRKLHFEKESTLTKINRT